MSDLAACTIVSKNYLPFARVLARSFAEHNPDARFFVLLVDRVDGAFDPAEEPFELIEVERLAIPDLPSFLFKYTILEANTAVKPFFLEHLMDVHGVGRLLYLDPDIRVYAPLAPLFDRLAEDAIVLLPHLTAPIDTPGLPDELTILRSGAYNLGFLGIANVPAGREFLRWWGDRIADRCVVRLEEGLFVDQKWVDLVPGLWPGVAIDRDPGYDVAYWNLHSRRVRVTPEGATVDGRPLVFFHFSGLDPEAPERISKFQSRFRWSDLGDARILFRDYSERILAEGWREQRGWPYAFGVFSNGVGIPNLARRIFFDLGPERAAFGDPFDAEHEGSFFAWLDAPEHGPAEPPFVSRLLAAARRFRPDLAVAFPDPAGADLPEFARWLAAHARADFGFEARWLEPVIGGRVTHAVVERATRSLGASLAASARAHARQAAAHASAAAKDGLKAVIGAERAIALKRRLVGRNEPEAPTTTAPAAAPLPGGPDLSRVGVNVAGYIRTESGVGEGVRTMIRALEHAGIPHALTNLEFNVTSRMADESFSRFSDDYPYGISVFAVNADQVPEMLPHVGVDRLDGRYLIGYWAWELDPFPRRYMGSFEPFREIWTPSRFCADVIGAVAPVPVRRVPHAVEVTPSPEASRARFGLPEDAFLVLLCFDYMSFAERKNPRGLVRAFRRAFAGREDVALVLKSINGDRDPAGVAALAAEAEGTRVVTIDRYLERQETIDLMAVCDAYASLHRSEGFGLTLAEAMCLGKPVMATQWSGNADFMSPSNSFPVGYRLVTLNRAVGPYDAGGTWADPDLDHAVEQLRRIVDDPEGAAEVGRHAARDIGAFCGRAAVAEILRSRLAEILERYPLPPGPDLPT